MGLALLACLMVAMAALSGRGGWPGGPLATDEIWPLSSRPVRGDPVSLTQGLYVDPHSQPATWVRQNPLAPQRSIIEYGIADRPLARWFVGAEDDARNARAYVRRAAAVRRLPVLVAYNIPWRDCGGYSAGGAGEPAAYRAWVDGLVDAVGSRPAVVILEPDALAGQSCRSAEQQWAYLAMMRYAVDQFADHARNTWVFLDAGHSGWNDPATMAQRLRDAGVERARGFSLNVSNYQSAGSNLAYGQAIVDRLAEGGIDAKFVIDTGRSGSESNAPEWCNPPGQRTGEPPGLGRVGGLELALWVKAPGESDGTSCGIAPGGRAGQFLPALAEALLTGDHPTGEDFAPADDHRRVTDLFARWSCPFTCPSS